MLVKTATYQEWIWVIWCEKDYNGLRISASSVKKLIFDFAWADFKIWRIKQFINRGCLVKHLSMRPFRYSTLEKTLKQYKCLPSKNLFCSESCWAPWPILTQSSSMLGTWRKNTLRSVAKTIFKVVTADFDAILFHVRDMEKQHIEVSSKDDL